DCWQRIQKPRKFFGNDGNMLDVEYTLDRALGQGAESGDIANKDSSKATSPPIECQKIVKTCPCLRSMKKFGICSDSRYSHEMRRFICSREKFGDKHHKWRYVKYT
ncbi:Hypothetical predicted protein, partial [Paramuricea clavata]